MKFKVFMKDASALYYAIHNAVEAIPTENVGMKELKKIRKLQTKELNKLCKLWFEDGEYLTLEIDAEAKSCIVIPQRKK